MASVPPTPESNAATDSLDWLRSALADIYDPAIAGIESIGVTDVAATTGVAIAEVAGGVAADIAGFPVVIAAVGFTIGMYAIGWLLKKVTEVFPDPGIFGWHPLGFINDGLNALSGVLERQALSQIHLVAAPIMTLARYGAAIVTRIVNAFSHAHNKAASIVDGTIPGAVAEAAHTAAGDVVRLDQQIVSDAQSAVVNMLKIVTPGEALAFIPGAQQSRNLSAEIAGVGAASLAHAGAYTDAAHRQLTADIARSSAEVAKQAQDNLTRLNTQISQKLAGDASILSTLTHEVTVTLPADIASQVKTAQAQETAKLTAVQQSLQREIDKVRGQIDTLLARITSDEALINQARQDIATAQATEARDVARLTSQEKIDYTALKSVQDATAKVVADQGNLIRTAQSDILTNRTAIADANQKITGISNTLGPIQKAQQLNTLQLAPFELLGATALPTVLQTLTSTLNQVKTKVDTCLVETCDPASPLNIRNVLRDLLGLLTAAGEIGFIADAIHDPLGVANSLAPILDSIDQGAVSTLDALLSL